MTSQVQKEGIAQNRNAYYEKIFCNPNETQSNNILTSNEKKADEHYKNTLLKKAMNSLKSYED
jgi:hypothetical protein